MPTSMHGRGQYLVMPRVIPTLDDPFMSVPHIPQPLEIVLQGKMGCQIGQVAVFY